MEHHLDLNYRLEDTIAAISTSFERDAPVGIIRVSGANAPEILSKLSQKPLSFFSHAHLRKVELASSDGSLLDEALVVLFNSPLSFTGEDLFEVQAHGNRVLLKRILAELVALGARLASPGEFSYRAYLNGKIDLSQAEAISEVIVSESPQSLRMAQRSLSGGLKKEVIELKQVFLDLLSFIELEIDFLEQGYEGEGIKASYSSISKARSKLKTLLTTSDIYQTFKSGIQVALLGVPNSGKSLLFNRLLNEERSIVTPHAGTTRDLIKESLELSGAVFEVFDTAGLREFGVEEIEAIGIKKTWEASYQAELILYVLDSQNLEESLANWNALPPQLQDKSLLVVNKLDLVKNREERMESLKGKALFVSAETKEGLSELKEEILTRITNLGNLSQADLEGAYFINRRQTFLLEQVESKLELFLTQLEATPLESPDLLSIPIKEAISLLDETTGATRPDDVVQNIFQHFCIGK